MSVRSMLSVSDAVSAVANTCTVAVPHIKVLDKSVSIQLILYCFVVQLTYYLFLLVRGVVPLRHLSHPLPDSLATLVNSLQNRVKSITLNVTLNTNNGKIVLVKLCIQIEWLCFLV